MVISSPSSLWLILLFTDTNKQQNDIIMIKIGIDIVCMLPIVVVGRWSWHGGLTFAPIQSVQSHMPRQKGSKGQARLLSSIMKASELVNKLSL